MYTFQRIGSDFAFCAGVRLGREPEVEGRRRLRLSSKITARKSAIVLLVCALMPRYTAADSCTWSGQSTHIWPFSVGWFCLIELSYHELFLIIQPFDFKVKSKVNWCTHISDSGLQDADLGFLLQSCFLLNYSKKRKSNHQWTEKHRHVFKGLAVNNI